jgi:anti-sigma B factor antagonist
MGRTPAREVMSIDIKVETRKSGEWAVVDVEGEVDVFTAPKLREQIIALLTGGSNRMVVNLEKVGFMDSTGLGVLVGGLKRVKEKEGTLALAGAHGTVLRVLNVTGLNSVFPMHETVEQATGS